MALRQYGLLYLWNDIHGFPSSIRQEGKNMKHFYMLTSSIILLVFSAGSQAGYKTIPADTLQKWITQGTNFDFLFIDVRETSEATTVIATDSCKPYLLPWTSGVFTQTLNKLPKDTAIVIYCASGNRSGQAAQRLVDSGFTSVYSLTGGFNNWGTRPTKSSSFIKSTDLLPQISMHKKSTAIRHGLASASVRCGFWFSENAIFIASPISVPHTLSFFDLRGKCVVSENNPFAHCTVRPLNKLSVGFYAATLESGKSRNVAAVRIVK
jgi:rhodanese-related sulfurtransferase